MSRWPWAVLRICSTVTAVLMFDQAVFAGQFLAGSFGALHTHRENATAAGIAVLVTGVSAVLVRVRGGGPRWLTYACLGLFGLVAAQIAMGFARVLTIHVPLGVAIIALTLLLTGWSWRASPDSPVAADAGHTGGAGAGTDARADTASVPARTDPPADTDSIATGTNPPTGADDVAARTSVAKA